MIDDDRIEVPKGMPRLKAERGKPRQMLGRWMSDRFDEIEEENAKRIEALRNCGEHPSPIFARMVKRLAAMGTAPYQIARLLEIKPDTLQKYYGDVLLSGPAEANLAVAEAVFGVATDKDHPAFAKLSTEWLNRRGGEPWKPPAQKLEIEKKDEAARIIDSSKLTREERQQLREMIDRIASGEAAGEIEDKSVVGES